MKISMLGISGSGKTTFMAGLYDLLGHKESTGYHIKPKAPDFQGSVLKIGQWQEIAFNPNDLEFPTGTQKTTYWSFNLHNRSKYVSEIEWVDYRGGLLSDLTNLDLTPENKYELQEVLAHIEDSDALIIMADAWLITYFQDNNIAAAYAGIRRLYQILEAYARSHPGKDLIILIALTKADSVSSKYKAFNRSKLPDYTKLIARGKEIFETIITLSHRTPYWQIGIIAVTAIGEGRANPTIENGNKTFNRPTLKMEIKKFPKPVGVEPVGPDQVLFYCVGHILKKKMQMHRRNKRKYARQIRKHTGDLARSKKTLADLEDIRDHHKAASNDGTAPDMVFRFVEKLLIFIAKIFDYPFARLGTNAHRRRHQAVAAATDTHIQTVKDLIEIGQNSIQELQIKEANCMAIIAENRKFSLELRRLSRKTVKTLKPPLIA